MKRLPMAVWMTAFTTTAAVLGIGNRALLQPAPPPIKPPIEESASPLPIGKQPNLSPEELALPVQELSAPSQSALLELASSLVIEKFTGASCDEMTTLLSPSDAKNQAADPQAEMQEKAIALLQQNPEIRTEFLNKIAPPITNKMFDCNLIP